MSRYIDEGDREKVRQANDLIEVIGERVELERHGNSYYGCCPFHDENTPSFVVYPNNQTYHCYGCAENGDVFSFIMKLDGLDFRQAVAKLAERGHVDVPGLATDGGWTREKDRPKGRKAQEKAQGGKKSAKPKAETPEEITEGKKPSLEDSATIKAVAQESGYQPFSTLSDEQKALVESKLRSDRIKAVKAGYGLDRLLFHSDPRTRLSIAQTGHFLNVLSGDSSPIVRREVANQGYALDALHLDPQVHSAVEKRLKESGTSLAEWIAANPGKCAIKENRGDIVVEEEAARKGRHRAIRGAKDPSRWGSTPFSDLTKSEKALVRSKDAGEREHAALRRMGHNVLWRDPDPRVRRAVAWRGSFSRQLAQDPDKTVRAAVVKSGHCIDILYKDPDPYVRRAVVWKGKHLDDLWRDYDPSVRVEVARKGYALDALCFDDNDWVRSVAWKTLRSNEGNLSVWRETHRESAVLTDGEYKAHLRRADTCILPPSTGELFSKPARKVAPAR